MPPMKSVLSKMVGAIGYDAQEQALYVEFNSGKTARYAGVDPATADSVLNAPSIGDAVNRSIKNQYEFRYV